MIESQPQKPDIAIAPEFDSTWEKIVHVLYLDHKAKGKVQWKQKERSSFSCPFHSLFLGYSIFDHIFPELVFNILPHTYKTRYQ